MQLPRVRFTMRRMMAAVAAACLILAGLRELTTPPRGYQYTPSFQDAETGKPIDPSVCTMEDYSAGYQVHGPDGVLYDSLKELTIIRAKGYADLYFDNRILENDPRYALPTFFTRHTSPPIAVFRLRKRRSSP